jgi:N-formylglutamate deformylase
VTHNPDVLIQYGPASPAVPIVLDSPHSGHRFPADFDAAVGEFDLRDGEDCFIDELYAPAGQLGMTLLAAQFPRTYLDANRHRGDIDLELLEGGHWPHEWVPSGKAAIGKALLWRTLDDGRPIYRRKLSVAEMQRRIEGFHTPYHRALAQLLGAAHARFGAVYHFNCHSMNAVSGAMGEGGAGRTRADFVLGDRDGSSCAPAITEFVRATLAARGYDVRVNDPFKGVELVKAYSNPRLQRHSLQIEINKRLYMDEASRQRHGGFARLQADVMHLLGEVSDWVRARSRSA